MPDPFRGFIDFGREIMSGVRKRDEEAMRYKWLLGEISALFVALHEIVAVKLERVENATSPAEAESVVNELRGKPLSVSFHAQGLCDAFVGLGQALEALNLRREQSEDQPPGFLAHAKEIASRLMNREVEVAELYQGEIRELSKLFESSGSPALDVIRARAREARTEMSAQREDFENLANEFKRLQIL